MKFPNFLPRKLRDKDALAQAAARLDEKRAAAEKLTDPADRLEALLAVSSGAWKQVNAVENACIDRAAAVDVTVTVGGLLGCGGGGMMTMAALMHPFIGLALLLGSTAAYGYVTLKGFVGRKLMNDMYDAVEDHLKAVGETIDKSAAGIEELLKTRSNEIAASPRFDSIYDNYPEIRDSFIKTFNKAVARRELPADPAPAAPKPAGGLAL